jgi:RHS repeat-associated protein
MLGPASSAQTALDLSTVDRMALRALRFARLLTLVGCFLVVPMTFGAVSASANVWTVEGGTHYLKTSGGELIKSWTAKEWQVWRKEVQSVGECTGVEEHCAADEFAGETPVEGVSKLTGEDAQEGVHSARTKGESLNGEVQNALDLAGEDGGTLPSDLGANTIAGAELKSTRVILGVELGNGLDQLFEAPAWQPLTKAQEEIIFDAGGGIFTLTKSEEEERHKELNRLGEAEAPGHYTLVPGDYLTAPAGSAGGPSFGVIEEGIKCSNAEPPEDCEAFSRKREGEYIPPGFSRKEFIWDEGEYYPTGLLIQYGTAIYEYKPPPQCPVDTSNSPGVVGAKSTPEAWPCPPVGVPAPNLITPAIEEHNIAAGLSARPKESSPIVLPTKSPSPLDENDVEAVSESPLGRNQIEEMFPNKKQEETEVEEKEGELLGPNSPGEPGRQNCLIAKPVNCATGNETQTETDLSVGGRGPGLQQALTYNSLLAVKQATAGPFGFGWTGSYSAHLELKEAGALATVYQDNGSTITFAHSEESWIAPSGLVQAKLASEGSGYVYTLPDQTKLEFNSEGRLTKETDRNGNAVTLAYNAEKQLETATDGAGRKLTFKYNGSGEVEDVKDPMGHTVKYTYESGSLATVTLPGEEKTRWKYKYNSEHELTSATDGREHATTIEYNKAHQVKSQTDPLSRKRTWEYAATEHGTETKITEPNGATTVEQFNEYGSPTSVTHASGTSIAATTTYEYNGADELIAAVDPNKHKSEYGYDSTGDLTSEKNADGDETKWTYDSKHDIETETTPDGETTTIKRNSAGDPEVIERPAPGSTTQKTTYKYDADGDVESMTNPLERTWKYEYDSYGDRKAEIDPEGNKRTWEYNEDSQEIATVSPRGNAEGAEASKFTTKFELNAKGQPLKITDPLSHTTKYTYDGDGNVETMTDGNSHKTKYTYDADNELTKTEEPNKTVTETEYDSMGQVTSQTDGNKHVTKYVRNLLEEVEEVVNPLGKKTLKEYDAAGNLIKLTDPKGRTTTYTYDPANRLTEIVYSSGNPSTIKYEYNKDGDRTKMEDGTGTTTYTYDQLDRLTESENGHKEVIKYGYNLGNQQTKITYPNAKAVERAYDKDGRLEKITDWNKKETKLAYDQDSDLEKTTFPSETKDVDTYAYNDADQMSEVKMKKSTETLGSLVYTRDDDNQVKKTTSKDLPGTEVTEDTYDENNRLTKSGSTEYKYDDANNPTTEGSSTNTYNEGDELEKGTGTTYSYDELGERTKTTPEKGPATTYGYDQAGNLISAERPKEGETSEIKDTYAYNGEDLRTSQTISGTTSYLAWDMTEGLPLILSDGTNSYIYGPDGLPIEQINNSTGTVEYMHHDQQGSTRLLTGSTGKTEGAYTYTPYGAVQEHTGTSTTSLGYDGQYTSSDTGLIYMRARTYDPTTGQFLSVDPMVETTRAPYTYASDNPLNRRDPSGLVTVGICVSGEVALGIRVGAGVCGQVSTSGEVGATGTVSGGIATGAGASAGIGLQGSNAEHIGELGGPFEHLGGSIHAGGGASADTFYGGDNGCGGRITGGEVSLGIGAGADAYGSVSETETIAAGL